jgi:hypothetical protein
LAVVNFMRYYLELNGLREKIFNEILDKSSRKIICCLQYFT